MTKADRSAKIEEALVECLKELEAAIKILAREGIIHSTDLGKETRDGFRAALSVVPEPPTLAERIAAPGFGAEVAKARSEKLERVAQMADDLIRCFDRQKLSWPSTDMATDGDALRDALAELNAKGGK